MNDLAGLAGIFLLPLGDDMEVRLDFEKALEDEREALRRWLFEGQHPNVIIVEAKIPAMAFEMRFAKIVVEKGVVLEPGKLKFQRCEIQGSLEDAECFLFGEKVNSDEIADLEDKALHLLVERGERLRDLRVEQEIGRASCRERV